MSESKNTAPVETQMVDDTGTACWTILWDPKKRKIVNRNEKR